MNKSNLLTNIKNDFYKNHFSNEDDIKINFHSDIVKPILEEFNPNSIGSYKSENRLLKGGRTDATFQNVSFEFKKENHFRNKSGVKEALYGRNEKDHGLYDYIISDADINETDSLEKLTRKLTGNIGVGFDGNKFIFARFKKTSNKNKVNTEKTSLNFSPELNLEFTFEVKDFDTGLRTLILILKQQNKIALNKKNLLSTINTKSKFVRESILKLYTEISMNCNTNSGSDRIRTLYAEWDRIFGVMYGSDEQATDFTSVSPALKKAYGIDENDEIDSKHFLFALQTFFNIFLKLLVYAFLSEITNPADKKNLAFNKAQIDMLFDGNMHNENELIDNFFETHFLEWFTFSDSMNEVSIVNDCLELILNFDLTSYILKPEEIQDILQEVYMELTPKEMRHLMGEYFSPDWIVEHTLDMSGYTGDINKTLIDPTCGSGTFLIQALKRIIKSKNGSLEFDDIKTITNNIVGFDINPISVVSAKANFVLIIFSAFYDKFESSFKHPVSIPVYIADSILSPVIYSESHDDYLSIDTSVGKFNIPKFTSYKEASQFLKLLSNAIHEKPNFKRFWIQVTRDNLVKESSKKLVQDLFDELYILHRAGKNSFWPIILRNSFAPVMIGNKFDYVVGNPPWIAWKSMSKSYREGTLDIWQSYGIFEKNAYDKKTTHDDFGMAVTYVSIDQYLKVGGSMVFLLPASFLKSTKGGEGFRKFSIVRNNQNVPFSIVYVDDFSDVKLFTIGTVAIKFNKGKPMHYPVDNYRVWGHIGRKTTFDSHSKWSEILPLLKYSDLKAQPVDGSNSQSAWLTLPDLKFANRVLDPMKERFYKGRKGIEPAGAKGVYILKKPCLREDGNLYIENDFSRQRRADFLKKGINKGIVENKFVYPMLGGRNIDRWKVKSNEYIIVPHTSEHKYGIPEEILEEIAPLTIKWLDFYHSELLASRIQNGKFFNPNIHPFYRLDNVGVYTYSPYKVLWKEQTSSMSAVTIESYEASIPGADLGLFDGNKTIMVDSKILYLALYDKNEAYYISGILNASSIRNIIDGYAIATNRGTDVLNYLATPKFDIKNQTHKKIAKISEKIHLEYRNLVLDEKYIHELESELDREIHLLF